MKLKFPPAATYLKAALLAAAIALIGYLLFPALGLDSTAPRTIFAFALLAGAALGITAAGFALTASAAPSAGRVSEGDATRKTVFVGNLAFKANRDELREMFERYGTVHSVRIMTDRVTRRPRGFAFVEMDERAVAAAIKGLDGKEFYGRNLRVNEGSDQRPPRGEG